MITICEVGPRDGLQNEKDVLPPETRAELVDRLAAAGLPVVEAVSFVSAERVPQMAGAEKVVGAIERRDGTVYAGLALNEQGYERLREAGLDEVRFALAATESFSKRNSSGYMPVFSASSSMTCSTAKIAEVVPGARYASVLVLLTTTS